MQIVKDFIWLAITVYLEAQGEPSEGRVMVAMTILNRSDQRALTVKEVVLQSKQFSCFNNYNDTGEMPTIRFTNDFISCYQDCLTALDMFVGGDNGDDCNHYFADYIEPPSWSKDMTFIKQVGKHLFYRG